MNLKNYKMKNNVLINNFFRTPTSNDIEGKYFFYDKLTGKSWHKKDELLFDKSWDWLMPVIEKIEKILNDPQLVLQYERLIYKLRFLKFKETYERVVEWIEMYNEHIKN